MRKLRKAFAISVMTVTTLAMSGVFAVVGQVSAAASAGDLIKMEGLSSVYYLGSDGKRYVFPNETTFNSWYADFGSVVTVPQSELESYPLGANVSIRPGTKLVKITTDPKVYAVTEGGTLTWVPDEATASTLYGANWASRVVDVPDAFFTNYTVSSGSVSSSAYPQGSLVRFGGSDDVYYINTDGTASKVATEAAFEANRFNWNDVITATIAMPTAGAEITGADSNVIDTSQSGAGAGVGIQPGAGTGATAALASDTPASQTVITSSTSGQAAVPFTTVNITASADGDVKVTNLRFKRLGISSDEDVESLYLYDGMARLTEASSISSSYATFNNSAGLFTVPAGTTKAITLKGDLLYNTSAGKTVGFGIESASDITTDGAAISGSFPANGNLMSTATVTDLGQLTISGITPSSATTVDPDTTDHEIFRASFQSVNQELSLEKLTFTEIGSIQNDDISNFKLYSGGSQIASAANLDSNFELAFDLSSSPLVINKGGTKVLSIRADIDKGSSRTFRMTIQNSYDLVVKDNNYGVYVEPYTSGSWSVQEQSSGIYTINEGSLSVSKSTDSPTEDVVVDGTNVVLGRWDFKASGEDIKIKNIDVQANIVGGANGGIDNGKVYVNGAQIGSTKDLTEATNVNFTFGSTFIVKAGDTAKVEVIGDIKTTTSTSYAGGETVAITIGTGASNAQRVTSLGTFNAPGSDTAANTLNITSASLTVSKFSGYGNQTVVAGTNVARLGSFVLTSGASEGTDVSSITVALSTAGAATITNLYLKDNGTGAQLGETKVTPSTSNSFSVNFNIGASQSKVIDLYGDVVSGSDAGSWIANIDAEGTGSVTSNTISVTAVNIQTITVGSGALYANNGSHPDADILIAGSADNKTAEFTFTAENEAFTVSKLQFKVDNNFATSTTQLTIKYPNASGSTVEASAPIISSASLPYATVTFTGLAMYVPKDADATLETYVDLTSIANGAVSGANSAVYLDWDNGFQATGGAGTSKTTIGSADLNGNTFYVRKSKPTFARVALSGTPTSSGALYKFTTVADSAGNIEIKQLGFTFTTTGVIVTGIRLYDSSTGLPISDATTQTVDSSGNVNILVGATDNDVLSIGTTAKTYEVRGTVTGWGDTGDSLVVQFNQETATANTAAANTLIATDSKINVWSDRSATNHSTTSADWTNGFLLKTMTDVQSF